MRRNGYMGKIISGYYWVGEKESYLLSRGTPDRCKCIVLEGYLYWLFVVFVGVEGTPP